jgi:hypothetical protein
VAEVIARAIAAVEPKARHRVTASASVPITPPALMSDAL